MVRSVSLASAKGDAGASSLPLKTLSGVYVTTFQDELLQAPFVPPRPVAGAMHFRAGGGGGPPLYPGPAAVHAAV